MGFMNTRELSSTPERVRVNIQHLKIGQPNHANDKLGPGYELVDQQDIEQIGYAAHACSGHPTIYNTAFCMDARPIVQLGNITDPDELRDIATYQLQGGIFFAATMGAIGANANIVRDSDNFMDAYISVARALSPQYKDAGHAGCKATVTAEQTIKSPLDPEKAFALAQGARMLDPRGVYTKGMFEKIHDNKKELIKDCPDFFHGWSLETHKDLIKRSSGLNYYAHLDTGEVGDPVAGHHPSALFVPESTFAFAKNRFVEETGRKLLVLTMSFAKGVAMAISGNTKERQLIEAGIAENAVSLGNLIFAEPNHAGYPGMGLLTVNQG